MNTAISRRASLHEKIRDYEHAFLDLKRLISLLEKRSEKKYVEDLKVSRQHLSSLKRYMNKGMSMDLYMILGLKGSESGSEIKKAYHKAALRHHPDKAGKFLARSESGADGDIWKDIMTTIHMDADKLFKKIGEAYAVLSDANKGLIIRYHLFISDKGMVSEIQASNGILKVNQMGGFHQVSGEIPVRYQVYNTCVDFYLKKKKPAATQRLYNLFVDDI
nr:DnaJ homolog subfamily C member 7-like [Tanacetum cinerariifolium]